MKILVVDDDKTARGLLLEILKERRYTVLEAEDGRQALDILQKEPIDLILTDRGMPNMDGLELLKTLHERNSTIPVIMVSAYGEEKLWGQALGYGAKDYLLKPFKTQDVLTLIDRYLPKGKPKK